MKLLCIFFKRPLGSRCQIEMRHARGKLGKCPLRVKGEERGEDRAFRPCLTPVKGELEGGLGRKGFRLQRDSEIGLPGLMRPPRTQLPVRGAL